MCETDGNSENVTLLLYVNNHKFLLHILKINIWKCAINKKWNEMPLCITENEIFTKNIYNPKILFHKRSLQKIIVQKRVVN